MESIISITDEYLSPKVLPHEQSSGWIKWKSGIVFDKIILRYEADIKIFRLFNIDEEIFADQEKWNGKITIPKKMIQVDGFFGFTSYYETIPTDERKISYEIDIISGNKTQTIHMENIVTRPMLKVLSATPDSIQISKFSPQPEPLSLKLNSAGTASLHNLEYFIEFVSTDKLKVEVTTSKKTKFKEMTLKDEELTAQSISIKGKGNGLIRLGATYYDDYKTKYEDIFKEIPLIVKEEQTQTIPISEQIKKQETQLLTIPN